MIRLLRVISSMSPESGGPPQGIRNLSPALDKFGIITEVATVDGSDSVYLTKEDPFLKTHAFGPPQYSWAYSGGLMPWLRGNAGRFDAVILHGMWQFPGYALRRVLGEIKEGPPWFIYPHGMLDPWFQNDPTRRLKALRNRVYWRAVESRNVAAATGLLFTCAEEQRLAALSFPGYKPRAEFNVGYGVPEPQVVRESMGRAFAERCGASAEGRGYFLFLSRIHPKKGADLLIRAYAEFRNRAVAAGRGGAVPDLVIAGPGEGEGYGLQLQDLARSLCGPGAGGADAGARVYFPGMLSGEAKWGALHGARAFVLPSHQENFGISVVEALGCGKPVLISDQVNIWREIEAAGAGFVGADTFEGTLGCLEAWDRERGREGEISEAARRCAAVNFGIGEAARRLADLLKAHVR